MGKAMSTPRNQNYDVPWSDLDHDVLFLVMMRLGFADFPAFSRVCKSWRSLALSNWKRFIASRPPMSMCISSPFMPMCISSPFMSMCISSRAYKKKWSCCLEDFEGRKFKTILPHFAGRKCIGLACGYVMLFGRKTHDFWLVNPITRHNLHFPHVPFGVDSNPGLSRGILVFSPSVSTWLFVFLDMFCQEIWFSIAGTGAWNHVCASFSVSDLHALHGKIYTINTDEYTQDVGQLWEMSFSPPKLTLLETKNIPKIDLVNMEFVSYAEKLYVVQYASADWHVVYELDFGEMEWLCRKKTKQEYAVYDSDIDWKISPMKPESWWPDTAKSQQGWYNSAYMWYFPRECLNVNLKEE